MTPFFIIESSWLWTESRQWNGMVRARKHLRGTALLSRSICIGGPAIGLRCSSWKTSDHSDSIASLTWDIGKSSHVSAGGTIIDPACVVAWTLRLGQPTAILSCRYGPHEKSWKIGLGPLDLKSRPSPHCWVRRNSRESTNFHFGPVEGGFPGQRTTTKAPSLHTNCNWLRPQGLKVRPQGLQAFLPNFSTWLRHLLTDFDEWTLVGKLEIPAKRRRHFVPVSPRERTIAPFLRRVLTLSAQFPRIRTCSDQINLYRGEIAVTMR